MAQSVLITGGAGAIGTHLSAALLARGFRVVVLDDLSSASGMPLDPRAAFIRGSVDNDSALDCAFQWKPDFVIHMAALFANQNSVDHPEKDLLVNGLGTVKVLSRCVSHSVKKLLFFSSSCVYGPKKELSESDHDFYPETPYAITKLLGEQYCRFWAHHHRLNVAIMRVFNTYGPGELPGKYRNVIPNFISKAISGKPLTITGDGTETRSFIYVEDTVRAAISLLLSATESGRIYNIGASVETPILELAQLINQIAGNRAGIEFLPRRQWDNVLQRKLNGERALRELGFKAEVNLKDGLEATYLWLKENWRASELSTLPHFKPASVSHPFDRSSDTHEKSPL